MKANGLEAIQLYNQSILIDPNDTFSYLNRWIVYLELKNLKIFDDSLAAAYNCLSQSFLLLSKHELAAKFKSKYEHFSDNPRC